MVVGRGHSLRARRLEATVHKREPGCRRFSGRETLPLPAANAVVYAGEKPSVSSQVRDGRPRGKGGDRPAWCGRRAQVEPVFVGGEVASWEGGRSRSRRRAGGGLIPAVREWAFRRGCVRWEAHQPGLRFICSSYSWLHAGGEAVAAPPVGEGKRGCVGGGRSDAFAKVEASGHHFCAPKQNPGVKAAAALLTRCVVFRGL